MILTGKSKQDFEKWYTKGMDSIASNLQLDIFYGKSYIERGAYYLEWLDSVDVFISVTPVFPVDIYGWSFTIGLDDIGSMFYPDRISATKGAILKANDLYNEKLS